MKRICQLWRQPMMYGIAVLFPWIAVAQFNSSIQGVITDPSQALVAGVRVRVTQNETGVSREATSTAEGLYRVLNIGPGKYTVTAEKEGFRAVKSRDVEVGIDQRARLDFTLELAGVAESIQVAEKQAMVETEGGPHLRPGRTPATERASAQWPKPL